MFSQINLLHCIEPQTAEEGGGATPRRRPMCNLCSLSKEQAGNREVAAVRSDQATNPAPLPAVFAAPAIASKSCKIAAGAATGPAATRPRRCKDPEGFLGSLIANSPTRAPRRLLCGGSCHHLGCNWPPLSTEIRPVQAQHCGYGISGTRHFRSSGRQAGSETLLRCCRDQQNCSCSP